MDRTPFGRYTLEERLAVGGMAELFIASMTGPGGFKKSVVVKRLNGKLAQRDQTVAMFLREARLAGRFKHHNLIQVYELFDVDGQYAIAMEHLEGVDLGQLLARAVQAKVVIADAVAARIISGAAAGLHAAHELTDDDGRSLAVVHRDVSPTNVFVTRQGVVKVVDFGIATARDELDLTKAGVLKGKLGYMAPEQARGLPVDRRTDVYALGIVLYELLTRRRCYAGDDQLDVLNRVREGRRTPLESLRQDVNPELLRLCEQMLSLDANGRPESCEVVRKEAGRIAGSLGSTGDDDVAALARDLFPKAETGTIRRPPTAMRDILLGDRTPVPVTYGVTNRGVFVAASIAAVVVMGVVAWAIGEPEGEKPKAVAIAEDRAPRAEDRAPRADDRTPRADGRLPRADDRLPMADGREPMADGREPIADGRVPMADGRAPMADGRVPMADGGAPIADGRAPIADGRVPIAEVRMPKVSPRPKAEVEKQAHLSLTTTPETLVTVNGVSMGRTPLVDKRIDAGRWVIHLRDERSGLDNIIKLTTKAGELVKRELVFRTGSVVVNAQPWADVYLGGKKLGSTPLPPTQLYEGVYSLRLVNPELHSERIVSVTVSPGRTSKVSEVLK